MMEKLPEFLVALLLLQASSWAQDPAPPLENDRRTYGGSLQHQTEDSQQGTVLYFPDYVDGDGWAVQLALSNVNASVAAVAVVEVYGHDGQPVLDLFDSESPIEIPSFGSRVLRSGGAGPIRRGWIQVRTDPASVTGLLTYRQTGTGVEVSVEPVELGNRFALFVEESDTLGSGLAIFKPEASSGIELRIRDEEGNDPLEGEFPPLEGLQASRTHPPGVVRGGRGRYGFPDGFSGSAVRGNREWIPVRPAGAAVREEEPCALGGSCHPESRSGTTGDDPVLPGLRGWRRLDGTVGAQQCRREHAGRGCD